MFKFNFIAFLFDNNISAIELAKKLNVLPSSLTMMKQRGTVKASFIRLLKKKRFPNVDQYVTPDSSQKLGSRAKLGPHNRTKRRQLANVSASLSGGDEK